MLRLVFILCYCYATVGTVHAWLNNYDQPVHFQCPHNQFLSHVSSMHDNNKEDRLWDFRCSPLPLQDPTKCCKCHWTNYVNEFDRPVIFQCPNEGFITGMASVHNNHAEDRQFKFHCCEAEGTVAHSCYFTDWANDWDGLLDFTVPSNKILRGMVSYHDNQKEDRRFQFEICDFY